VNHSNATVNFSDDDPFDQKAVWLNAEHIRTLPVADLVEALRPYAGDHPRLAAVTPLIQERIKLLRDVATAADFFFADELAPYDPAELIPQKGDAAMAKAALQEAGAILGHAEFTHDGLEAALRAGAEKLKIKTGQMFQPIRVAVCGRKVAPPLFETLLVLGREVVLKRIAKAIEIL
jgi:glutamyl-tRNA synthetase